MQKILTVLITTLILTGCTWVELTEQGRDVSLISGQLPNSCIKTGSTTVSVLNKVVLERATEKVANELEVLARNRAGDRGDAIMASSEIINGEQSFDIYRCSQ